MARSGIDTSRKCQLPRVTAACRAKADSGKRPHHDVPITPPARPRTTAGRRRRRWRSAAPRARSRRAGPCRKISDSGRERRLPSAAGRRFSQVIVCARPDRAFSGAVIRSAGPDHPRARWRLSISGLGRRSWYLPPSFCSKASGVMDHGHTVFTSLERAAHGGRYDLAPRLRPMCSRRTQYRHVAAKGRLDPCANRQSGCSHNGSKPDQIP
jgi:hypothetical protein